MAHEPDLLILDEPTAGLDPIVRQEFLQSMLDYAAADHTVLLSSHQINEVERVADTVAILHSGRCCINERLETIRERVSLVTISLHGKAPESWSLDRPAHVLYEQTAGSQVRLVVLDFDEHVRNELVSRNYVGQVAVQHATLDEVFLAWTRGRGSSLSEQSLKVPTLVN